MKERPLVVFSKTHWVENVLPFFYLIMFLPIWSNFFFTINSILFTDNKAFTNPKQLTKSAALTSFILQWASVNISCRQHRICNKQPSQSIYTKQIELKQNNFMFNKWIWNCTAWYKNPAVKVLKFSLNLFIALVCALIEGSWLKKKTTKNWCWHWRLHVTSGCMAIKI